MCAANFAFNPSTGSCEPADPMVNCGGNVPVCGCNGITFQNSCLAYQGGVKYFSPGACGDGYYDSFNSGPPGNSYGFDQGYSGYYDPYGGVSYSSYGASTYQNDPYGSYDQNYYSSYTAYGSSYQSPNFATQAYGSSGFGLRPDDEESE